MLKNILNRKLVFTIIIIITAAVTFICMSSKMLNNVAYGYAYSILDDYHLLLSKISLYGGELLTEHGTSTRQMDLIYGDFNYISFSNYIALSILSIITLILRVIISIILFLVIPMSYFILLLSLYIRRNFIKLYLLVSKICIFCIVLFITPNIIISMVFPKDVPPLLVSIESNISYIKYLNSHKRDGNSLYPSYLNRVIFKEQKLDILISNENRTPILMVNQNIIKNNIYNSTVDEILYAGIIILSSLIITPIISILSIILLYKVLIRLGRIFLDSYILDKPDSFMQGQAKHLKDRFDSMVNKDDGIKMLNKVKNNM